MDGFRPDEKKQNHPYTSAVILCAGMGERFKVGDKTKQNFVLLGKPACVHTFEAFEKSNLIDEIIVVAREEELPVMEEYRAKYNITKISKIVCGGATRQESSLKGCDEISEKSKYVAIHDGARCLVTSELVDKTVRSAYEHGAAAAAERSRDTVKYSEDGSFIDHTEDRSKIWLVKTPQVFLSNMYRAGAYMAKKDGEDVTDDCMLAERLGFKIKLVECGADNMKLTFPEDVSIFEAILKGRSTQ